MPLVKAKGEVKLNSLIRLEICPSLVDSKAPAEAAVTLFH